MPPRHPGRVRVRTRYLATAEIPSSSRWRGIFQRAYTGKKGAVRRTRVHINSSCRRVGASCPRLGPIPRLVITGISESGGPAWCTSRSRARSVGTVQRKRKGANVLRPPDRLRRALHLSLKIAKERRPNLPGQGVYMARAWLGTFLPCNINFLRELLTQRWNLGRAMYESDWRAHQFHARLECSKIVSHCDCSSEDLLPSRSSGESCETLVLY